MTVASAGFEVGQIVRHRRFGYRGVIYDIDPVFSLSDDWYDQVALSRPPKDAPWYRVLVDGAAHTTYVAERHLAPDAPDSEASGPDTAARPVDHPLVGEVLGDFTGNGYLPRRKPN